MKKLFTRTSVWGVERGAPAHQGLRISSYESPVWRKKLTTGNPELIGDKPCLMIQSMSYVCRLLNCRGNGYESKKIFQQ